MPILKANGDNSTQIHVATTSDKSGLDEVSKGLNDLAGSGKDAEKSLGSFTDNYQEGLKKVAVATGVAAAGLSLYAKSSVDYLTNLVGESKNLARQTGMTVEESSKLIGAMQRIGVDAGSASVAFRTFAKQITEARDNASDAGLKQQELTNKIEGTRIQIKELTEKMRVHGDASGELKNKIQGLNIEMQGYEKSLKDSGSSLGKLGIATQDAEGKNKDFYNILLEVADKFKEMPDGAEKTSLALELFGKSGTNMIKVLNQGGEGIKELALQAEKLGLTLDSTNINAVSKYIQSQKELEATNNSLKISVAELTGPLLTGFNNSLNGVLQALIGVNGPLRDVVAGVFAFGGPILGAISGVAGFASSISEALPLLDKLRAGVSTPMVMPAIAVAAAIAALALVIAKTQETMDVIQDVGNALEDNRKFSEQTDAAVKKGVEEGRISQERYQTYLKNTQRVAEETAREAEKRYEGFFGFVNKGLDAIFVTMSGRQDQFKGSGFGGFASGGYTGRGGVNEIAGVVHRGEYVVPQQYVNQNTGQPDWGALMRGNPGGGGTHISVAQVILSTAEATHAFMTYDNQDKDTQDRLFGLTPGRGTA